MEHAYVFTGYDCPRPLAARGVVRAFVFVNAPIASPLGFDAVPACRVSAAVVIREIPADEILVRFG